MAIISICINILRSETIKIEANQTVDIDFHFISKEVVRPLYETIKSGRIKKDARVPGSIH